MPKACNHHGIAGKKKGKGGMCLYGTATQWLEQQTHGNRLVLLVQFSPLSMLRVWQLDIKDKTNFLKVIVNVKTFTSLEKFAYFLKKFFSC